MRPQSITLTLVLALALIATAALSTGCYRHHIILQEPAPTVVAPGPDANRFFILGFIGLGQTMGLDGMCPGGTARIYQRAGLVDLVAQVLTGGIISARKADFYCNPGGGY